MKKIRAYFGAVILVLSGCSGQKIKQYQNVQPVLDLRTYFSGHIDGWGMFQKDSGEVQKRFVVSINATQKNGEITLDEQFVWDDGSRTQRVWRLVQETDGSWKGTAGDVVGHAVGRVSGNALHWTYTLTLPVKDKTYDVYFDDWMYLIDKNVMLNRSVMSKWGITLGSVTLSLHKREKVAP